MGFEIENGVLKNYAEEKGVTDVVIPAGVIEIGEKAFQDCTRLMNITIPNGVTKIGKYAFCGCIGLRNITIPDSVTEIAENAFVGCRNLKNDMLANGVEDDLRSFLEKAITESYSMNVLPNGGIELNDNPNEDLIDICYNYIDLLAKANDIAEEEYFDEVEGCFYSHYEEEFEYFDEWDLDSVANAIDHVAREVLCDIVDIEI